MREENGRSLIGSASDTPIVDPWAQPKEPPKKRRRSSTIGLVALGIVTVSVPLALVGFAVIHHGGIGQIPETISKLFSHESKAEEVSHATPSRDEVEHKEDHDEPNTAPAPLTIPHDHQDASGSVPQETTVKQVGNVTVVVIGTHEASLRQALTEQTKKAKASGKSVLLMTVDHKCAPCEGVIKSLSKDLMQKALDPVVVVVIDKDVFKEEAKELRIQIEKWPGFFLLAPDMTPRDGIDGGEWGEDIAENIAPVLGPFVRGEYKNRKRPWKPAQGGGMFL